MLGRYHHGRRISADYILGVGKCRTFFSPHLKVDTKPRKQCSDTSALFSEPEPPEGWCEDGVRLLGLLGCLRGAPMSPWAGAGGRLPNLQPPCQEQA